MRGILIALAVMYGAQAMGADLAKAPAAPVAPLVTVYNGGFYVGLEGGYGWNTGENGIAGADFGDASAGATGAVFGGYGGWGMRFGNFYGGFEGNWDWTHISGGAATPADTVAIVNTSWLASARARLGYFIAANSLIYGTVGWGWANSSLNVTDSNGNPLGSNSVVNSGWAWGGGLETPFFFPAVRTRLQYLQYNLGTNNALCVACDGNVVFQQKDTIHTVTLGLHYTF